MVQLGADPQNLATPKSLFDRLTIPTKSFFVRSHFGAPAVGLTAPIRPINTQPATVGCSRRPRPGSPATTKKTANATSTAMQAQ